MPIVEVHLLEGYTSDDKGRLGRALTDAVRLVVPAAPEAVTVMIHEMPEDRYYRGGVTRTPAPALPDPESIVLHFLKAMEARDLAKAETYLAPEFVMQFPGAEPMHKLSELVAWAAPRYQSVSKTYDGFDTAVSAEGAVVHCRGTLSGVWPDGSAFAGIRFADRFELQGGKITRQDVWNDIAEVRTAG